MNNKVKDLYNGKKVQNVKPRTIGDIHYDYYERMLRRKQTQDRMKKKLMLRLEIGDEG